MYGLLVAEIAFRRRCRVADFYHLPPFKKTFGGVYSRSEKCPAEKS